MPTPQNLRDTCQVGKDRDPAWYRVHRRWSVYLSAFLLRLDVDVNHVSLGMMAMALLAAALLSLPDLRWNALGVLAGYFSFLLDKVDGEIARYRGQQAPMGILLDRFHHRLVEPLVFLAVGLRAQAATGSATPVIAALATMLAANIVEETQHLPAYIAAKHARETGAWPAPRAAGPSPSLKRVAAVMRALKTFRMYLTVLPLVFAAMVAEAVTGQAWTTGYLVVSAAGLWLYVLFQAWYFAHGKLDTEIASLERRLPPLPPRAAPERAPAEITGSPATAPAADTKQDGGEDRAVAGAAGA